MTRLLTVVTFLGITLIHTLPVHAGVWAMDTVPGQPACVKKQWAKGTVIPAAMIGVGAIVSTDEDLINKFEIREERNEWDPLFRTHVDDYLQFAPIVAVYGLNAFGVKGKHDFVNRTALLLKSEIFLVAMVTPLKAWTKVPRPDTGIENSFPSGHTAQAFAAATFLHKEYGKDHPLYSVLGYATATGIGVLRVLNNRHWASDVIAGAGVGILATNLAYLTHKEHIHIRHPHAPTVALSPLYYGGAVGAGVVLGLK